ncbi:hypothetical protein OGAPHI_002489 [Ogataea philodendri]|uniref:Uncharacterized protein n=1 Tax=Ogataea philodendri TaxID=1378263 RepID=A0A9P8T7R5_9ASCO|nr:uncharacterized protein OGAPHI_002489 [Ogataea philodendri]KAH3668734.1 hypothetical protein OGAPHI_002489 [Ogataea philodendri]
MDAVGEPEMELAVEQQRKLVPEPDFGTWVERRLGKHVKTVHGVAQCRLQPGIPRNYGVFARLHVNLHVRVELDVGHGPGNVHRKHVIRAVGVLILRNKRHKVVPEFFLDVYLFCNHKVAAQMDRIGAVVLAPAKRQERNRIVLDLHRQSRTEDVQVDREKDTVPHVVGHAFSNGVHELLVIFESEMGLVKVPAQIGQLERKQRGNRVCANHRVLVGEGFANGRVFAASHFSESLVMCCSVDSLMGLDSDNPRFADIAQQTQPWKLDQFLHFGQVLRILLHVVAQNLVGQPRTGLGVVEPRRRLGSVVLRLHGLAVHKRQCRELALELFANVLLVLLKSAHLGESQLLLHVSQQETFVQQRFERVVMHAELELPRVDSDLRKTQRRVHETRHNHRHREVSLGFWGVHEMLEIDLDLCKRLGQRTEVVKRLEKDVLERNLKPDRAGVHNG